MNKEQKFYKALQDVFIGARIEGEGGFVNLMRIKSNYYRKIEELLKQDIEKALEKYPDFRNELFDKLYSFFSRYFTESGSIYFNQTPFHNNIYEKVYTDEKDVILFWKTQMLYYVKTDRIFRSLPVEFPSERGVDAKSGQGVLRFYFDASKIENKKANEKRSLVFELDKVADDSTIIFGVKYSERGMKTKQEEILKAIKRKGIAITEEQLERAFRVFEKQSEVDFFINKNAKAFLQEQFKLWSYQYFWEGAKEWSADRVNQLQILKDIAFKIIDFIAQFEDELVKIWNKPKFVKNSNYVITLDRIKDQKLIEKILKHKNIKDQLEEWQELGIVDEKFKLGDSPFIKGWQSEGLKGHSKLPFNSDLKQKARELRKAGNLSEVLLWNELKQKKMLWLDFTRQQVIGNYIVDFHCPKLNLVIEIDGQSHDFKGEYDEKREEFLKSLGLTVLHFQDVDVKKNLNGVVETIKKWIEENTPSAHSPFQKGWLAEGETGYSQTPLLLKGEYEHLPIDTKYFKDLELEILSQFEDLDKSLDGWLIKSENYQALNTILPKFKEKVQTIYIDPPFNLDSSAQFLYRTNYKDANWATLLENRLRIARDWLNEKGSIFVRCDYNGNWIVRPLMNEIFGKENFRNEIGVRRFRKNVMEKEIKKLPEGLDTIFIYSSTDKFKYIHPYKVKAQKREGFWRHMGDSSGYGTSKIFFGRELFPPKGKHWKYSQEKINQMIDKGTLILVCSSCGYQHYKTEEDWKGCPICKEDKPIPKYWVEAQEEEVLDSNWTDLYGYSTGWNFQTENSEILLKRVIESTSNKGDLVMDFFLGSGTTTAVAHKLGRKWIGVEMGEHFYSVVLPRMKKVLFYDPSGISKELKTPRPSDTPLPEGNNSPSPKGWQEFPSGRGVDAKGGRGVSDGVVYQGGGFFKYYELEQYEEALANCKYDDGDLFSSPFLKGWHSEGMMGYSKIPYQEYVFMKDEKLLKALEIGYEKEKVKVDLSQLYPNIDIAKTLSNLTGKWIKRINTPSAAQTPLYERGINTPYEVEFEDGTKINTKDLDYKLIKPLIWWE
jgi:adenine specific DNA methylase Mod/very-short-patch-repair endonuclease